MKQNFRFCLLLLSLSGFIFSSCKKQADNTNSNFSITEFLSSAQWEVAYYADGDTVLTDNFKDYTFTFLSDGKMYAANETLSIEGAWTNDNTNQNLNITISGANSVNELTNLWEVISTENSSIQISYEISVDKKLLTFVKK